MTCGKGCAIRSSVPLGLLHARTGKHSTGTAHKQQITIFINHGLYISPLSEFSRAACPDICAVQSFDSHDHDEVIAGCAFSLSHCFWILTLHAVNQLASQQDSEPSLQTEASIMTPDSTELFPLSPITLSVLMQVQPQPVASGGFTDKASKAPLFHAITRQHPYPCSCVCMIHKLFRQQCCKQGAL